MKQIIHQANQILCKQEEFHTQLFIDKSQADATPGVTLKDQEQKLRVHTFDMCRSTQVHFKIKVKGEASPLKFKLEYYDSSTGRLLQANQHIQLRGQLDVFVSRSTDNPQQVQSQIADSQNHCEKFYTHC